MTAVCEEVMDRIGDERLPRVLEEHVQGCEPCQAARASFRSLEAPGSTPALPAPKAELIRARSLAAFAQQPIPIPWWVEAAVAAFASVGFSLLALLLLTRGEVHNLAPGWALFFVAFLLLGLGLAASVLSVAPVKPLVRQGLVGGAFLVALLLSTLGSGTSGGRSFLGGGLRCFSVEIALSALPLAFALWASMRWSFEPWRTVTLGLVAGLPGLVALHAHCANGATGHLFFFHVLPWFALAGGAVVIRQRLPTKAHAP